MWKPWKTLHLKVRWAAAASALVAALLAVQAAFGTDGPAWLGAAVAGIAAFVAGYSAPSHGEPQDITGPVVS